MRQLLHVWDVGAAQAPPRRALTLLAAAWPGSSWDSLTDLSIGQRNHRLLRLRAATFRSGPDLFRELPALRQRG